MNSMASNALPTCIHYSLLYDFVKYNATFCFFSHIGVVLVVMLLFLYSIRLNSVSQMEKQYNGRQGHLQSSYTSIQIKLL